MQHLLPAITFAILHDGSFVQVFGVEVPASEQHERMNAMGRANASCVRGATRMEIWTRTGVIGSTHFVPGETTAAPPAVPTAASDTRDTVKELEDALKSSIARIEQLSGFLVTERTARAAAEDKVKALEAAAPTTPLQVPSRGDDETHNLGEAGSTPAPATNSTPPAPTDGVESPSGSAPEPAAASAPSPPPPVSGKKKA